MKNKLSIFLIALAVLAPLSSCGGLSVPTGLAITDRTLSWSEVKNAESYVVLINEEDAVEAVSNNLLLENKYYGAMTFKVAAVSGDKVTEYSESLAANVYLTLATPSNVRQDGNYVRWDEVGFANGYVIKVGTVEHAVATNEYQLLSSSPAQVSVLANGSGDGFVISSAYSNQIWFKVSLATPTNIAWSEGLLTWSEVANAASYQVVINNGSPISASTNSCEVGYDHVGSILFKVRAISDGEQYFDSALGQTTIQINPLDLGIPQYVRVESGVLKYDSVAQATAYGIYHNGIFLAETSELEYTIPNEVLSQSGSYLQVQARSTIHNDSELSEKAYLGALEIDDEAELRAMGATGYYVLADDIALTSPWNDIAFSGVFDGANHTISGLAKTGDVDANCGFFSSLDDAEVFDLTITGAFDITTSVERVAIGGLAGKVDDSIIINVDVAVNIDVVSNNGIVYVGGLAGYIDGGDINSCIYNGDINVTNGIAGGFVGQVYSASSKLTTIISSGSEGSLTVSGGEQSYAGGFVGLLSNNNATISQSRALIAVIGTSYVGGFVGYMAYGSIDNAYSRGGVDSTSSTLIQAGGFAGRVEGYNNSISYSIGMAKMLIEVSGSEIYIGSFAGVTPGGSYADIYSNCHYDSTLSNLDRIGNTSSGRGDGISGLSSSELLNIANFNASIWSFSGESPILQWEV
ncbi:MAG: hypothetical protein WC344_00110 [Bacilli bacterium]|jgi:hypothetical protein